MNKYNMHKISQIRAERQRRAVLWTIFIYSTLLVLLGIGIGSTWP